MDSEFAEVMKKHPSDNEGNPLLQKNQRITLKSWRKEANREQSIQHVVHTGRGELSNSIENIILQMKVGDVWEIKAKNILNEKNEEIFIEILSSSPVEEISNATPFQKAEKAKANGNSSIKEKKYKESIEEYERAYQLLEYACDSKSVQLKLSVISNLALATLTLGKYNECLEWCERHTRESLDPSKKIIYRQASAERGIKEWERAKRTIAQALKFWEGEKETEADFKQLGEQIEKDEKTEKARQKKVYANMFG